MWAGRRARSGQVAAEAPGVVILRLPRGYSARKPRDGSDAMEFAITVQWVPVWSLGSAGSFNGLFPALSSCERCA